MVLTSLHGHRRHQDHFDHGVDHHDEQRDHGFDHHDEQVSCISAIRLKSSLHTPLHDFHVAKGGKMVDFAGWE